MESPWGGGDHCARVVAQRYNATGTNLTVLLALIFAPVFGLTPTRALRVAILKVPKLKLTTPRLPSPRFKMLS
jgi:hypothetical protein